MAASHDDDDDTIQQQFVVIIVKFHNISIFTALGTIAALLVLMAAFYCGKIGSIYGFAIFSFNRVLTTSVILSLQQCCCPLYGLSKPVRYQGSILKF